MATRLDPSVDYSVAGCRHGIEAVVKNTIRSFFAAPPANTTQTVSLQLRNALQTATGFAWTNALLLKAVVTYSEDE